jgi:23S rRNA pseudouridine2605 synthase
MTASMTAQQTEMVKMRINKYIAACGVTSRRKADELIAAGRVRVNGYVLDEPGYDVIPGDAVEVDGRRISPEEKKVYYLLNKPAGFVTTVSDDRGRPTVVDLIPDAGVRIFPVGRLDCGTSGLIVLTNDGDLANRMMHPSHELDKTYRALVKGTLTFRNAERLRKGVDIGGFVTSPAKVEIIRHGRNSTVVDITIHEGKNRQVRRMFAAVGCPVQKLERTAIGKIVTGRLAPGKYRKLSREEVEYLRGI